MSDLKTTVSPNVELDPLSGSKVVSRFSSCVDGYSSVGSFLDGLDDVLIIMNDLKRSTPTKKVLMYLERYLETVDVGQIDFSGLVATGSHSPPSDEEIRVIAGGMSGLSEKTLVHKARENEHIGVGVTSRGTSVKVDELITGYDGVICINSVEPHYFAGYTGGRKSIVPGVSGWRTIEENHSHALSDRSMVLNLEDNPVHLDMVEGCKLVVDAVDSSFLGINLVNFGKKIFDLQAGTIEGSFNAVLDTADKLYSIDMDREQGFDVVVSEVTEPLNKNLYQSLKGFENGRGLCKTGGVLILVSECSEGVGPSEFYERMKFSDNPIEIIKDIERDYTLGSHKTYNLLKFLENHEIFIVSDLPDKVVENCFCRPFPTLEKAYNYIRDSESADLDILVIKESGNLVPKLNG
ncbi:nickel-dependent lactate racemase [Methanonatronarchaeum sp. AMET-Sl]|uniref:nickel-dependent lactate racemase n=1 Tax=Methanonatronarchaeum sp. AMET-Sl TaxID=3037654 RepID=UPI00244DBBDA|nr:nickel-dependent lactate racemase [Methanonatronarchaeum sp. AMET-Sl]WGI16745.1 nickel-dependent lactate racemase [Methanonatronarchaeum sp. AMET-Sl]